MASPMKEHFKEEGTVFVLNNLPENKTKDMVINYVETVLNVDVSDVKLYPFIQERALVFCVDKIENISLAAQKIRENPLESKELKLLTTGKKTAVVVHDIDLQKCSKELLCLHFTKEFAAGSPVIASIKTWPELNLAVVNFHKLQKTVVENILRKHEIVISYSQECHFSANPFYHNFHEYIRPPKKEPETLADRQKSLPCVASVTQVCDSQETYLLPKQKEPSATCLVKGKNEQQKKESLKVLKESENKNNDLLMKSENKNNDLLQSQSEKIKKLEEELAKQKRQLNCIEKIKMTDWQKEFASHCFGSFEDCIVKFDAHKMTAILEGKFDSIKERYFSLLREISNIKDEMLILTPVMCSIFSRDLGKQFLHNLNSFKLIEAKVFLQDNHLLVAAKDNNSLNFAKDILRNIINYKETFTPDAKIPTQKLNSLQATLENRFLVKVLWSKDEIDFCVEGIRDDVLASVKEIKMLIDDNYKEHEKSFTVTGLHAKFFHKNFKDHIEENLAGVKVVEFESTEAWVHIKFKGDKARVNQVYEKLAEVMSKIATNSWDLSSEFAKPEDLMLIGKGLTSEKMKKKIESFEMRNKCNVFIKLPILGDFSSKFKERFKSRVPVQLESKLQLVVTDNCQLIIKPYGDITKEPSDVLVCLLDRTVDLQRTRVGQTFNIACPNLLKNLKAEHEAHPKDKVLITKGQLYPLKCQAIFHVILTQWNPYSSPAQLSDAIQTVISQAAALGAKSISFPVLGCGRALGFPPSEFAQITCASIKSSYTGKTLQKIVLVAPDREVFQELKNKGIKNFQSACLPLLGGTGETTFDDKKVEENNELANVNNEEENEEENDDTEEENDDNEEENDDYEEEDDDNEEEDNNKGTIKNNEDKASGDEKTFSEIPNFKKLDVSKVTIIALCVSSINDLWSKLKKKIVKTCLHTDDFNEGMLSCLPKETREIILEECVKLNIWMDKAVNTKTGKLECIIKGEKQDVEIIKKTVIEKFYEEYLRKVIPKRGTCEFLRYAANIDKKYPSYWKLNNPERLSFFSTVKNYLYFNHSKHPYFLVDVDENTKNAIKELVNKTWDSNLVGSGNDARSLKHTNVRVINVKRIENDQLFQLYSEERKLLLKKMIERDHICSDIGMLPGSKGKVAVTEALKGFMKEELYDEVNEHYLFHGTKSPAAIMANGIDPQLAKEAGMFGKGIYTAEMFTKADQYTDLRDQRSSLGTTLNVIMARVLLGNVFVCDDQHKSVQTTQSVKLARPPCMHCLVDTCVCNKQEFFDSVMGDGRWIFREFIIYKKTQCYPEYLITYERV